MVARFAGARSLDDRRRRRIVTETDADLSPPPPASLVAEGPGRREPHPPMQSLGSLGHLPLRKLISPRLWKHLVIGMVGVVVGMGLLMAVASDWSALSSYGSSLPQILSVTSARALTGFSGTLLFVAGQLSLLCWWARSRSTRDFSGRYGIWMPTAVTLFLWAGSTLTGAHQLLGTIAAQLLNVQTEHGIALCWLLPTLAWGMVLFRPLIADMRGCRLSLSMLWFAAAGWLTAGWLLLGFSFPLREAERALAQSTAALLGNGCLFMGLLLHARHVIYVTAEPPAVRPSRWRWLKSGLRRVAGGVPILFRRTKNADRDNVQKSKKQPERSAAAKEDRSAESRPAKPNPARPKVPASADERTESATATIENTVLIENSKATLSGVRIDGPPTPDQLKGLNKRERRMLRKQWRDVQRATGTSASP